MDHPGSGRPNRRPSLVSRVTRFVPRAPRPTPRLTGFLAHPRLSPYSSPTHRCRGQHSRLFRIAIGSGADHPGCDRPNRQPSRVSRVTRFTPARSPANSAPDGFPAHLRPSLTQRAAGDPRDSSETNRIGSESPRKRPTESPAKPREPRDALHPARSPANSSHGGIPGQPAPVTDLISAPSAPQATSATLPKRIRIGSEPPRKWPPESRPSLVTRFAPARSSANSTHGGIPGPPAPERPAPGRGGIRCRARRADPCRGRQARRGPTGPEIRPSGLSWDAASTPHSTPSGSIPAG